MFQMGSCSLLLPDQSALFRTFDGNTSKLSGRNGRQGSSKGTDRRSCCSHNDYLLSGNHFRVLREHSAPVGYSISLVVKGTTGCLKFVQNMPRTTEEDTRGSSAYSHISKLRGAPGLFFDPLFLKHLN